MRSTIAIALLAGTMLSLPAVAQTSNAPAGAKQQANSPVTQASGKIQYITQNRPDLWRASKLEGINVYNQNNEKIGDINEVLVDRQGKVEAVVIGVGGFLGLGERSVAVPFDALQWQNQERSASAANVQNGTPAGAATPSNVNRSNNMAMNSTGTMNNRRAANTANTTSTGDMASPATTGTVTTNNRIADTAGDKMRDYPERAILPNATKEQLKNAPEFKYADQ